MFDFRPSNWPYGYTKAGQLPGGGVILRPGISIWPIPGSSLGVLAADGDTYEGSEPPTPPAVPRPAPAPIVLPPSPGVAPVAPVQQIQAIQAATQAKIQLARQAQTLIRGAYQRRSADLERESMRRFSVYGKLRSDAEKMEKEFARSLTDAQESLRQTRDPQQRQHLANEIRMAEASFSQQLKQAYDKVKAADTAVAESVRQETALDRQMRESEARLQEREAEILAQAFDSVDAFQRAITEAAVPRGNRAAVQALDFSIVRGAVAAETGGTVAP